MTSFSQVNDHQCRRDPVGATHLENLVAALGVMGSRLSNILSFEKIV